MTVDTTPTGVVYTVTNGNAGQEYPIVFPYVDAVDVKAYSVLEDRTRTQLIYGTDYTVSGQIMTTITPLAVGARLAIYRETPLTQEILWVDGQAIYAPDIMQADDKITFVLQEMSQDVDRAVKISREDEAAGKNPEDLANDLFDAREAALAAATLAEECRDQACECAGQAVEVLPKIHNAAQDEIHNIVLEGDKQVNRVKQEGGVQISLAHDEAVVAKQAAKDAQEAAALAEDVSHMGPASRTNYGFVRIGDGINVTPDGTISVSAATLVSTPSVTFPELVGIGYAYTAIMSAESAVPGVDIDYFLVSFGSQVEIQIPAVNNQAEAQFIPDGANGTTGSMAVVAIDANGNQSRIARVSYIQNTVFIDAPAIVYPQSWADSIPLITTVTWQAAQISGVAGTPIYTELQIAKDVGFTDIFYSSPANWPYALNHTLELPVGSTLHARVRHCFAVYGWSDFGPVRSFATLNSYLEKPVISSPSNGQQDVSLTPAIAINEPGSAGQSIVYRQTQVSTAADFGTTTWDSGQAAYAQSVSAATLAKNTTYYARVRLFGSVTGWTDWSAVVSFTTQAVAINESWTYSSSTTFTAPATGKYTLEVAGGGGGGMWFGTLDDSSESSYWTTIRANGGAGGYAKSTNISLTKGQQISITVGGGGNLFNNSEGIPYGQVCGARAGDGGTSSIAGYISATGGGGSYVGTYSPGMYCSPYGANGSNGSGSGGNTTNQSGGGGSGGNTNGTNGSSGYCKLTYTGA